MTRKDLYAVEVGRGYEVVLVQQDCNKIKVCESAYNKYDVELRTNTGYVTLLSTGCYGRKSGDYWCDNAVKIMKKITFMADSIDMAMHNLMCYSKNLLMDTPKEGYADEWHRENDKAKMLRAWMRELTGYWGEDNEKTKEMREIFADYIWDGRADA